MIYGGPRQEARARAGGLLSIYRTRTERPVWEVKLEQWVEFGIIQSLNTQGMEHEKME